MAGKIKSVTNPRLSLNMFSTEDIERLHEGTLEIIESVGVKFPSTNALDIWELHGAKVDRDSKIVRVPANVIEGALKQAPPEYTLAARDPTLDLPLDGNHVYVGTDGCGVHMVDNTTGKIRRSCLQDVVDIARVADDLEEIYLQIAEMVVLEQYIISYDSGLTGGGTHDLQITVEYQGLSGSDSRQFTACP